MSPVARGRACLASLLLLSGVAVASALGAVAWSWGWLAVMVAGWVVVPVWHSARRDRAPRGWDEQTWREFRDEMARGQLAPIIPLPMNRPPRGAA